MIAEKNGITVDTRTAAPARKMIIQPYRRIRLLVQNGIISASITRFFHLAVSFAIK